MRFKANPKGLLSGVNRRTVEDSFVIAFFRGATAVVARYTRNDYIYIYIHTTINDVH